nr:MAG TPA: hypothetical protein [Caudoviricetes sp.]
MTHKKYDIVILNERFKGRLLRQSLFLYDLTT